MAKIKWNSERILSLSAMSISFITLIIFIYQTNLMSRQNYLSILPYLQLSTSIDEENYTISLSIQNYGVGPAIIESVKLQYKGEEYDLKDYNNYFFNFIKSLDSSFDSINQVDNSSLDPGMAIPPNTNYSIYEITSINGYDKILSRLALIEKDLFYEIRYKSIQDERWMINEEENGPIKLD